MSLVLSLTLLQLVSCPPLTPPISLPPSTYPIFAPPPPSPTPPPHSYWSLLQAIQVFSQGLHSELSWKQVLHLYYWELLWCYRYVHVLGEEREGRGREGKGGRGGRGGGGSVGDRSQIIVRSHPSGRGHEGVRSVHDPFTTPNQRHGLQLIG